MKKVGIVGGVGWRATVEYYSGICELTEARQRPNSVHTDASTPEIAIESLDLATAVRMLGNDEDEDSWAAFDAYHRNALLRLKNAGADFAVIASNTPHHRLHAITQGVEMPVIDLFSVTARADAAMQAREVVILGTAMTMQSRRFREEFEKRGIHAHAPASSRMQTCVLDVIAQLQRGVATDASATVDSLAREVSRNVAGPAPAICLACTELPLAFPEWRLEGTFCRGGILYLSTTALHIRAAVDRCLSSENSR